MEGKRRTRRVWTLGVAALVATLAPGRAVAGTQVFAAVADAYVSAAKPGANFGGLSRLKVDSGPAANSYLRFDVRLPAGAVVTAASLEAYAASGYSEQGFSVAAVADSGWGEYSLTYANAPAPGAVLGASGPWSGSGYLPVALPAAAVRPGLNSFALTSAYVAKTLTFLSRESGSAPRLRLSYALGPAPPSGLAVTGATQTSISLAWSASPDAAVTGYDVYRDGSAVATTSATAYTLTGLSCGNSYTIAVDAYDGAGNRSAATALTAATSGCPADTTAPSTPANVQVSGASASSISLAWSPSSDNVAVAGYGLYRDGSLVASSTQTSYTFTGLGCGSSYALAVDAYDSAGNRSGPATVRASTNACVTLPAPTPCGTATSTPASVGHVIWIWMENKGYGDIIGNSSAPYENSLANQCGLATNYSAITHPSLPNYIAATSGSDQGITDDGSPSSHALSATSIFQQVSSWRAYNEAMPFNCDLGDAYPYAVKHNPAAYYTNIRAACGNADVAMGDTSSGAFLSDLNNNTLPAFSFITPDLCNDTHDCPVSTGDAWLSNWVPKILGSPAYQSGSTVLFITWDEDDGSVGNHIATIVVSPYTPAGKQSTTAYNHYSLLRTTEELLGVGTYLGGAATAASMRSDFFGASAAPPPPPSSVGNGPPVPANGAYFGAWDKDPPTSWTEQGLSSFETMIGRKLKIDHHYYSFSDNFPYSFETWDLQNGRIPMISWDGTNVTLDSINSGKYDTYFRDRATALKNLGQPVFLRPLYEMNGNWMDWDGYHNNTPGTTDGPSKYVNAWRRMHDIFASAGATNVGWVWAPNADSVPTDPWNDFRNYYPGDSYVDWVGIDGYNWGASQSWSSWQSFSTIFSNVYNAYAATKPIMIAETSSCEAGGSKASWITDAAAAIKSMPAIHAIVWFNENMQCDWRVNTSQSALDAFRAMGADAYFNPR